MPEDRGWVGVGMLETDRGWVGVGPAVRDSRFSLKKSKMKKRNKPDPASQPMPVN
jgi:hypothetical protein